MPITRNPRIMISHNNVSKTKKLLAEIFVINTVKNVINFVTREAFVGRFFALIRYVPVPFSSIDGSRRIDILLVTVDV